MSQQNNYSPDETQSYILSFSGKFKNNGIPYPGRVNVLLKSKTNMKVEVADPFGFVTVATLLVAGDDVTILNSLDKKFYQGPYDKKLISHVIGIDIERQDLFDLFYGEDFTSPQWECLVLKTKTFEKVCAHKQAPVKVIRKGSDPYQELKIAHEKSLVTLKLKSFKPTVSTNADYKTQIPEGYTNYIK